MNKELVVKNNLSVNIIYSRASGEFRHEVVLTEEALNSLEDKNVNPVVDYFYTKKDAVKFCEENYIKMK